MTGVVKAGNGSADKLSPRRSVTPAQRHLIQRIEAYCRDHIRDEHAVFIIQGDAGTGKSLVLNAAFSRIQAIARSSAPGDPLRGTRNSFLVNHPEMIKLYRHIAEASPELRKKDYERPTTFINTMHKTGNRADITFIDEAHLLLTRSDRYNRFRQDNQLEEIVRSSRVVVLVFDPRQVLKFKSHWSRERLMDLLGGVPSEVFTLTRQFRVRARPDVMAWIGDFCAGKLTRLPAPQAFDFRIFDDAEDMHQAIRARNAQFGLCRVLSTYDYPYTLDGRDHFIEEGRFRLRWDRAQPQARLPWAEREDTIDEVGSVYTVQGFDLNYAGVILGPSVSYDARTDRIVVDPARYEDAAAFVGKDRLADSGPVDLDETKQQIVFNSINVLLTRGMLGLYVYASNPPLRRRLSSLRDGGVQRRKGRASPPST